MVSIASTEIESEVEWPAPASNARSLGTISPGVRQGVDVVGAGLADIRLRYRGSVLAVLVTISTLVMVVRDGGDLFQLFAWKSAPICRFVDPR